MGVSLSIVVPVFNEEESLVELCSWIDTALEGQGISYEVLLIDDGSTDSSWNQITKISVTRPHVKGIRLNRQFGKSAALQTGFKTAIGKVVITMDSDLQDSPEEIPALYKMITEEDYQLVSGWKKIRRDPLSKRLPSRFFNFLTRQISGIPLHDFNCGLKAYDGTVTRNINVYGEMHRLIPVIAKYAGFTRIGEKEVKHYPRKYGTTKFGFERFVRGFLDLVSITFVSRFSRRPMHFFGSLGILFFVVGFLFTVWLFWQKMDALFVTKIPLKRQITDQPIFYLALVAVIIGVQLFLTGFIAELFTMRSLSKREYLVIDRVGFEHLEKLESAS